MNRFLTAVLLLLPTSAIVSRGQELAVGQDSTKVTMCEHLQSTGKVSIAQDARLENLLAHPHNTYYNAKTGKEENANRIVTSGYRVRVFSGNNQLESKNRAYNLAKEIADQYPDLATYIVFRTPNWRLTVGNFRTSEEAYAMLRELKSVFPGFGREMFIIKDEIELPIE